GNIADCQNTTTGTMTGTRCMTGTSLCQAGMRVCSGAVEKSTEVCNGSDDDCNGVIDDVPGIGKNCSTGGVKTLGPCTAQFTCNGTSGPGPNGLTCTELVGPSSELCNGIDDDCDGTIDNNLSDPRVGVTGGSPCPALMPIDSQHPFPSTG